MRMSDTRLYWQLTLVALHQCRKPVRAVACKEPMPVIMVCPTCNRCLCHISGHNAAPGARRGGPEHTHLRRTCMRLCHALVRKRVG